MVVPRDESMTEQVILDEGRAADAGLPAPARASRLKDEDLAPSPWRAWLALVGLSVRRTGQVRQMVWIALALVGLTVAVVSLITAAGRWGPDFNTACERFSRVVVFDVLLGFLLPIWSLSFATQALGGEREGRTLVWLLTRPLSRPAVYLAKF